MEERAQQMSSICRFCLCQDNLICLTTTTGYAFSLQDVQLYTGIPICEDEQQCYAICHKCRQTIVHSVNFRDSCLNNDIVFKKIFSSPNGFAASTRNEPPKSTVYEVTQIEILNDTPENAVDAISVSDDCQEDANTLKVFRNNSLDDSESIILQSCEKRTNRMIKRRSEKQLCVKCGLLVSDLTRHATRIHSNKTNSCPYCNIKINDLGNLRRHVNSVHIKKIAKSCELCNKGFTNKGSYLSHMQSQHAIGETYECDICSKTFNHKSNYRAHCSRVHGKEKKQYKCATCCKVFQNKAVLHVHQRVHSDDRPYACNQCSKCFKSSFARNAHQLTHSGVQFSCTVCSKSFKYKSVLYTHLKKDHPKDLTTEAKDCNRTNNNAS